jgi:3-dehydroquinate synthase II
VKGVTGRERVAICPSSDDAAERSRVLAYAVRRGFRRFVVRSGESLPPGDAIVVDRWDGDRIIGSPPGAARGRTVVGIRSPEDLATAVAIGHRDGGVAVSWGADRVIPLENLLALGRGHFEVEVIVDRVADLPAMLGALEHGADLVIVPVRSITEVDQVEALSEDRVMVGVPWELVAVRAVSAAGMGDRVIVDTTSLLQPGEGMLVGSAAALLLHVASEAVGSRFTRPRPFRVNAGAAHLYTLLSDGATRYLSELAAGDSVLVTDPHGGSRAVRVGRVKIERRPLALIEVERGPRTYTAFLQDAETVRLSSETGPVATTHLTPSMRIYGAAFPPARHLGDVVSEAIEER